MASNKKAKEDAEAVEVTPTVEPVQESIYTAAELADNHKVFGTYREIVVVALRSAGRTSATFSEAQRIIDNFKNKEVK